VRGLPDWSEALNRWGSEAAGDRLPAGEIMGKGLREPSAPSIVLAGFPSDEGVRRNHGRPGAALAPNAMRKALYQMTLAKERALRDLLEHTRDLGDATVTGDVEADQVRLADTIAPWLASRTTAIILGGGHETAYGHFLAHVNARQDVAILNWDAHPDVRPLHDGKGHSGSPFRQSILHPSGRCRQYVVAGLLPSRLAPEHLEFITQHGGRHYWRSELSLEGIDKIYGSLPGPLMVSFDMDAVDQLIAPGVSAPARGGMTAELWLHAAAMAGRNRATLSMDLVEVNPTFDVDGRTVLLAARTILAFLGGVAERPVDSRR
jgi:formiminoglutamase